MGENNNYIQKPLVSIVIITYNAANYIQQTLDSVKFQTYTNLELIISDDASTDGTIEICERWLSENKNRFLRTEIISVQSNTGVAGNCNRGIKAAKSDWIKFMAGDDIFMPNCIEDNMKYVSSNPQVNILFSKIYKFYGDFNLDQEYKAYPNSTPLNLMDPSFSAADQYKILLLSDRITYTPSYFFNKKAVLSVGGYDEHLQYQEDYPMWLKLTKAGIQLYFMDKVTVAYRLHEKSLNSKLNNRLFSIQYIRTEAMRNAYVYPNLPWDLVGQMKFKYIMSLLFSKLGIINATNIHVVFYRIFTIYLNPFYYIIYFKKNVLKLGRINFFYNN